MNRVQKEGDLGAKTTSRMERKKEETISRIVSVAVDLFNRHGLNTVTMEQIAEEADIAKGTLYNYFPSKEAIINTFLQRSFAQRNTDRVAELRQLPDTRARLTAIFTALIEGVKRQQEIFEAFMVYRLKSVMSFRPVDPSEQSGLSNLVQEVISAGQQSGELRTDLPEILLSDLFEFALIEAIKPLYLQPETYDQNQAIANSIDLFMNGAKTQ